MRCGFLPSSLLFAWLQSWGFGVFWSLEFGVWTFWSVSCKLQWFCCCLLVLSLLNLVYLPAYREWMLRAKCLMKCLNGMWLLNMPSFVVYSLNRLDYEVVDVSFDNRRRT